MEDETQGETTYELVLAFMSDDPLYAQGFAMGALWEQLKARPAKAEGTYLADCLEQINEMAHRLGYRVGAEGVGDGWVAVTLTLLEA